MPVTEFAWPDGGPLLLVVLGTDDDARLRVRVGADAVARAVADGVLGATPELAPGLLDAAATADEALGGLEARLRPGPSLLLPAGLGALEAAQWLADDPERGDLRLWLLAGWNAAAGPIRTIWDYLPLGALDRTDASAVQDAALELILDEHPELPIELADLAQALGSLELPGSSALGKLAAVLAEAGVANERLPDDGPLGFAMGDDDDEWPCLADLTESGWLVVYAELPESAAATDGSFAAAFAAVAGINARLQVGALLIDGDDGSLMYRAGTDAGSPVGRIGALRRLLDLVHADVHAVLAAWREGA